MMIMFPQGRLGNQIFQYQFVRSRLKNKLEKIITTWKCEYHKIFDDGLHYLCVPNPRNYCYLVFRFLASKMIISSILAEQKIINGYLVETGSFVEKKGLISSLKFIDGFFQTDQYASPETLIIQKYLLESAKSILDKIFFKKKIFVHIRRGDYLEYTIFGIKDCTIPEDYYKKAISKFSADENVGFIIISDDEKYAKDLLSDTGCKSIVHSGSSMLDFVLMTMCDGAITSSSSFSWWGAYLQKDPIMVVAPKFWLGFKSNLWYPIGIDTSKFEFMEAY